MNTKYSIHTTHIVRHHGEENERSFRCKKCKKCIGGENLLNKHIKRELLQGGKNIECVVHKPPRWFKTAEGRDRLTMQGILKSFSVADVRNGMVPRQT